MATEQQEIIERLERIEERLERLEHGMDTLLILDIVENDEFEHVPAESRPVERVRYGLA